MRGLILAVQFLTRLPTPQVRDFEPSQLSRAAGWFPLVGALVGALVAVALWLGSRVDPWVGALAALSVWVAVTGALHLDGLSDLADALGAAHRDPTRFLEVLRDPHLGTFGAVALVLALLAKLVLLAALARVAAPEAFATLCLAAAWARYGAVLWSRTLPSLAPGSAERFAWAPTRWSLVAWGLALAAACALASMAWFALAAGACLAGWHAWLKRRLGGMTGDCLGAGVELTEIALLAFAVAVVRAA